jgi:hypothetical protein
MNIVEFNQDISSCKIAFCIVDDTDTYADGWIKEIIKNIADFTISNITVKGYPVFQGFSEDKLLDFASEKNFEHAVVMSPGTEYINGSDFFIAIEQLVNKDYFIAGHILDRGDAYYELHHQCYLVNLKKYKQLNKPKVGKQELGSRHCSVLLERSTDNWHDNYTPTWVKRGHSTIEYNHKCHGWNLISTAMDCNENIIVFDENIRNSKKHHYPESSKDFYKKFDWICVREKYCLSEHIHRSNTEYNNEILGSYNQLVLPASGTMYHDLIDSGIVIFYDYSEKALNYWKEHCERKPNIEYKFIKTDLLNEQELLSYIDTSIKNTIMNFSNIFCYEGTMALSPLKFRVLKENELIRNLQEKFPNAMITFSGRAASGFVNLTVKGKSTELELVNLEDLIMPTWHKSRDWI